MNVAIRKCTYSDNYSDELRLIKKELQHRQLGKA